MPLHHRACNLCEACCGILVETEQDRVVKIEGDENDPLSRGYICPKVFALVDLHEDPDRLRRPVIREGDSWREVEWDEAFRVAAQGLHAVQKTGGRDTLATYFGNPTVHNLPAQLSAAMLIRTLDSQVRFSASTVDQFPHMLAAQQVFGGQLTIAVPDVDRCRMLIMMGANPLASNGSFMTAPGIRGRLRAIQKRGGKVVVIDPRRTETARLADRHLFIRPSTDPLLLLAMLNVIFAEGLVAPGAADGLIDGAELIEQHAASYTPEAVELLTGIAAADIRELVKDFTDEPAAAVYPRIGTCLQPYGTLVSVLALAVNLLTGKVDREGGLMFPHAAIPNRSRGRYGRWKSRVRGMAEFAGEIPAATMAEEMDTPGEGQLRGLVTLAGNPVLSTPNGRRLEGALEGLDFMVSLDPALNETTRFANVILPPRSSLMNPQYSLAFHQLAVRDTARFSQPVFEAADDDLSEWEISRGLLSELVRLRNEDAVASGGETEADPAQAMSATVTEVVDMMLAGGEHGLTVEKLSENPSGLDLGALKTGGLARVVLRDDGRVKLGGDMVEGELERLAADFARGRVGQVTEPDAEGSGMLLVGRRHLRSNNSWMHNCPSLAEGKPRCTALINPADASRLDLADGQLVSVQSRVGRVDIPVELSDEIMVGVVSIPHGWGHDRPGTRMKVAAEAGGVSVNDLTDEAQTEGLTGNAVLNGVPVTVAAA